MSPNLLSRLRAALAAGVDEIRSPAPHVSATAPPREPTWERFVAQPTPLASANLVSAPGHWFTHHASGAPLLVARGEDGVLRGFLNACLHQGNRIVGGESGESASGFQCSFHGWSYDTCGRLVEAADTPNAPLGQSLVPVNVEEHAGLVLAIPSTAERDVAAWLGPLAAELETAGLGAYRSVRRMEQVRRTSFRSVAAVLVDPARLGGWSDARVVVDADGAHLRFAAAPVGIADGDLFMTALRGWFFFPSTLLLVRGPQVSIVSAFVREDGRVGWRHETLVAPGLDPDVAFLLQVEQRLYEAESVLPRNVPGVRWLDARLWEKDLRSPP